MERNVGWIRRREGHLLAPLVPICESLGTELKLFEGPGKTDVWRGGLCIPLNAGGAEDTHLVPSCEYIKVDVLADVLGLEVSLGEDSTMVSANGSANGLGFGETPPAFTLPDLYTGDPTASWDFLGRKVVFYMWASW
jgi:hypothetical protein